MFFLKFFLYSPSPLSAPNISIDIQQNLRHLENLQVSKLVRDLNVTNQIAVFVTTIF